MQTKIWQGLGFCRLEFKSTVGHQLNDYSKQWNIYNRLPR